MQWWRAVRAAAFGWPGRWTIVRPGRCAVRAEVGWPRPAAACAAPASAVPVRWELSCGGRPGGPPDRRETAGGGSWGGDRGVGAGLVLACRRHGGVVARLVPWRWDGRVVARLVLWWGGPLWRRGCGWAAGGGAGRDGGGDGAAPGARKTASGAGPATSPPGGPLVGAACGASVSRLSGAVAAVPASSSALSDPLPSRSRCCASDGRGGVVVMPAPRGSGPAADEAGVTLLGSGFPGAPPVGERGADAPCGPAGRGRRTGRRTRWSRWPARSPRPGRGRP